MDYPDGVRFTNAKLNRYYNKIGRVKIDVMREEKEEDVVEMEIERVG